MIYILEKKRRIADNFKQQRIKLKISRRELAIWTGVSYGSLRRFEETGDISFEGFIRIAEFLGWDGSIHCMIYTSPASCRNLSEMRLKYPNKKFYED